VLQIIFEQSIRSPAKDKFHCDVINIFDCSKKTTDDMKSHARRISFCFILYTEDKIQDKCICLFSQLISHYETHTKKKRRRVIQFSDDLLVRVYDSL
jgi:hypothetical protein